jgi:hypothetical protein
MASLLPRLTALAALLLAAPAAADDLCLACLSVRVGPPIVVRGPFADELDNQFSMIRLPDGTYRGFTANGVTYAVDGLDPYDMGGPRRLVLRPAPGDGLCGRWLNGAVRVGDRLVGFVHDERVCDYRAGTTDKSMEMVTSADNGLTWVDAGTIIAGAGGSEPGRTTGAGDCGVTAGGDGFLYAYCLRNSDWQTIAARAPLDALAAGAWRKYAGGAWEAPGTGGEADALGPLGTSPAWFPEFGRTALLTDDPAFGGLRLAFAADKVHFEPLAEPLVPADASEWRRPAASELTAYLSLVDPTKGGNTLGRRFILAAVIVPPGADFDERYLVFRDVALTPGAAPVAPQVGIALTRWKYAAGGYAVGTGAMTGLLPAQDASLGYLMTRPPEERGAVKLEECRLDARDQVLAVDGTCRREGGTRLRTAGYAYADEQPDTLPLYRCSERETAAPFVSNRADCEGRGAMDYRLGYGLAE